MSVSKWRYTEACDGRPCVGDCDFCSFDPDDPLTGLGREIPKEELHKESVCWILDMIKKRDARTEAEKDALDMAIEALQAEPVKHGKWIEGE